MVRYSKNSFERSSVRPLFRGEAAHQTENLSSNLHRVCVAALVFGSARKQIDRLRKGSDDRLNSRQGYFGVDRRDRRLCLGSRKIAAVRTAEIIAVSAAQRRVFKERIDLPAVTFAGTLGSPDTSKCSRWTKAGLIEFPLLALTAASRDLPPVQPHFQKNSASPLTQIKSEILPSRSRKA